MKDEEILKDFLAGGYLIKRVLTATKNSKGIVYYLPKKYAEKQKTTMYLLKKGNTFVLLGIKEETD